MATLRTQRTKLFYLLSKLGRWSPFHRRARDLQNIFNYLPIHPDFASSGQPTESQFHLIKAQGFTTVINLAPHHAENALADEAGLLAKLGLNYHHIPVDFKHPTETDFAQFTQAMQTKPGKVWLHCAANMRASAFVFRYRREQLGEPLEICLQDLHRIWEPYGVWAEFIRPALALKN
ncbi:protein tyrosine phosphatase family protein [Spongiibacter sp. KMU-158]|uniref:Protein tyrosine phosphatase family protein n=1 Tax=Spongiibacter pelagi TaxID=2760804 RepID=A0A927C091_9GAMM|nr:protein tyrosine phosphatase family protein [Spongiibacter pelagi]MBD2857502.1 protein tyrosine phosphatase family protein [Spongiibacter pelagi]